jgi:signal transduction histidine kinase/ligand-binding sensor domain-containing protein
LIKFFAELEMVQCAQSIFYCVTAHGCTGGCSIDGCFMLLRIVLTLGVLMMLTNDVVVCLFAQKADAAFRAAGAVPSGSKRVVRYAFDRYTQEQGLPNETIQCMMQDKRGFLWIGTEDGLCRFDGVRSVTYRHDPQDSTSLPHSWIRGLYCDKLNRVWVSTLSGVGCFVPETGGFHRIPLFQRATTGEITGDGLHMLWVLATFTDGNAIYQYDTRTHRAEKLPLLQSQSDYGGGYGIHYDGKRLWAFHPEDVVPYWYDPSARRWHRVRAASPDVQAILDHPVSVSVAQAQALSSPALADKRNIASGLGNTIHFSLDSTSLYFTANKCGAGRIDRSTGMVVEMFRLNLSSDDDALNAPMADIVEMSERYLWLATLRRVYVYDRYTKILHSIANNSTEPRNLPMLPPGAFFRERSGTLWLYNPVRAGYGLYKYAPHQYKFSLYRHNPLDDNSLSSNVLRVIAEDRMGRLLVSTQAEGLSVFDRATHRWTRYTYDASSRQFVVVPLGSKAPLYGNAWHIVRDSTGRLWVRGSRWDEQAMKFVQTAGTQKIRGLKEDFSVEFAERDGMLWASLKKGGRKVHARLRYLSSDSDVLSLVDILPVDDGLEAAAQDVDGTILYGGELGLCMYNAGERRFVLKPMVGMIGLTGHIKAQPHVTAITIDRRGRLWVATKGSGVGLYNRQNQHFEAITERDGLPHNVVYAIIEDARGMLWMSTNNGVCEFNPDTRTFRYFDEADGLQGKEYNRFSWCKLRSGEIAFGGVQGLNIFHPDHTAPNPFAPLVEITDVKVFGASLLRPAFASIPATGVVSGRTSHLLANEKQGLWSRKELVLPYDSNFVAFELAAIDFTAPSRNRIRYKLEGIDANWVEAGVERIASYTKLPFGEYVLRVQAVNADATTWQSALKQGSVGMFSLRLVITPPWWRTWWFYGLSVTAVVFTLWGTYRWRVRSIEHRARQLEHLVNERTAEVMAATAEIQLSNTLLHEKNLALDEANRFKTQMLSIAAHDLKNPLSAIMGLASVATDEVPAEHPVQELLHHIQSTAERMSKLIRDLLDSAAIELGNITLRSTEFSLSLLLSGVVDRYTVAAEHKQQTISIECSEDNITVIADHDRMEQVFDNLISNAVKYSPLGGAIAVRVSIDQYRVRVAVSDEGPGLSEEDKAKLFGFFQRLTATPTGGESSNGVGLAIVKKIVDLHGGALWCESERDKGITGATFVVELPVRCAA